MGITRKIALSAGVLGILSGLIFGLFALLLESQQQIETARLNADRILRATVPQIESAYWEVDVPAVRAIMAGLLEDPVIRQVTIQDPLLTEALRTSSGLSDLSVQHPDPGPASWLVRTLTSPDDTVARQSYVLSNPRDGAEIGQLIAEFSFRPIHESLVDRSLVVVVSSVMQALLVTAVIFLVMQITVMQPISHLKDAAVRVRDGQGFELKGRDQRMLNPKNRDEISRLSRAFHRTVGELEDSRDNLQAIVDERTKALVEARNEAVEASRAKSLFLANMSHELRTPLNAINGLSDILLQDAPAAKSRRHLADMRTAAVQLSENIDSVLDLSKIEAGQLVLEQVWFDLNTLLDDVLVQTRALMAGGTVRLEWDYADDLPTHIRADPLRLRQILVNFTSNAVKFTSAGTIIFQVQAARHNGHPTEFLFTVKDTGVGIAPESLDEVFKPFGQADTSTTRQFGGTGLGLSIAQRLAHLMQGDISVQSTLGSGTTFALTVPLETRTEDLPPVNAPAVFIADQGGPIRQIQSLVTRSGYKVAQVSDDTAIRIETAPDAITVTGNSPDALHHEVIPLPVSCRELAQALRASQNPRPVSGELAQPLLNQDVLIVEDNRINRSVFVALVERLGAKVRIAENGIRALEQVAKQMPDLILMDLHMPHMDGHQAMVSLGQTYRDTLPPVIAMTANATPEEDARCAKAGFFGFLPKPVNPDHLRGILTSAINPAPLDRERGLFFAGNDADLYAQNLTRLRVSLADWRDQLIKLIDTPAPTKEASLLHTIKGVASTVGATALERAAQSAEATPQSLHCVVEALDQLAPALKEEPLPQDTGKTAIDPAQLAQLAQLIQAHDLSALDEARKLAPSSDHQDKVSALVAALTRLDFATAQDNLEHLKAALQDA